MGSELIIFLIFFRLETKTYNFVSIWGQICKNCPHWKFWISNTKIKLLHKISNSYR